MLSRPCDDVLSGPHLALVCGDPKARIVTALFVYGMG